MTMLLLPKAKDPGPIAPTACEILVGYENTPLTALGLDLDALLQPSSTVLWIYLSLILWKLPPIPSFNEVMNALVGLAGIRLPTLTSYDRESLTEYVVLQASPGIVGCIECLVLAGWKEVGGRDAIDCTLEDRMEVFFEVGMGYLWSIGSGDRRVRRIDNEVF